ncbi:hypothetical protein [Clostridium sp. ZS2-4]|uniref:hypothetical protein n=1 Tax=Clostridium sp. ZS2-4 TaxID=2987703 RepID=UPI00227B5D10|nr:hypothetical protein [Clostridium sp. ZS2-4]MCY6354247.1 hypothetical protein [Clostridium sp. ZS2-4]
MVDKKLTKRDIQAINTRKKIYDIAMELIKKEEFYNVSINQICKEAEDITRSIVIFGRGIIYDWCLHNGEYDLEKEMRKRLSVFVKCFKL